MNDADKECLPKNGSALYNKPILLAILFSLYLICSFQDKCSSNKTPRNFIDPNLSAIVELISWEKLWPKIVPLSPYILNFVVVLKRVFFR